MIYIYKEHKKFINLLLPIWRNQCPLRRVRTWWESCHTTLVHRLLGRGAPLTPIIPLTPSAPSSSLSSSSSASSSSVRARSSQGSYQRGSVDCLGASRVSDCTDGVRCSGASDCNGGGRCSGVSDCTGAADCLGASGAADCTGVSCTGETVL